MNKSLLIACMACLVLVGLASPDSARASEGLRKDLGEFAAKIKKVVDEENAGAISVGEFTGPATPVTSSGPGIQHLLIQALQAQGVTVKAGANVFVKGEYLLVDDPKDKDRDRNLIRLEAVVRNKKGTKLLELQAEIRSNDDIAKLVAATANLQTKAEADNGDRNEAMKKQIDNPKVFIVGSKIKANKAGQYAVEVLVGGKGRAARIEEGLAFVGVQKGEIYAVRVFNQSEHEAAVSLTIDGLDVFTFSEVKDKKTGQPLYKYFIVPPKKSTVLVGWHHNNKLSSKFQVVDLKNSALAKVANGAKLLRGNPAVGTLTVCFHMAWEGTTPPAGARDAGGATGFGPPVKTDLKEVQRSIGVLREVVSVRYSKKAD